MPLCSVKTPDENWNTSHGNYLRSLCYQTATELKILCARPSVGLKLGETLAGGVTPFKGSSSGSPSATGCRGVLLGTDAIPEGRKCDTLVVRVKSPPPIIFKGDKRETNVFTETLCCRGTQRGAVTVAR